MKGYNNIIHGHAKSISQDDAVGAAHGQGGHRNRCADALQPKARETADERLTINHAINRWRSTTRRKVPVLFPTS